jgi:membrane protein
MMQDRLSATVSSLPGYHAARGYLDRDRRVAGSVLSAGIALRLFLTALPVALLAAAAIGFMKPSGVGSPADVAKRAGLTASLAATIKDTAAQSADGRWALLGLGLVLLLWASVGVYRSLQMVYTVTWNLPLAKSDAPLLSLVVVSGGVLLLFIVSTIPNALRILDPTFVLPSRLLMIVVYTGIWLMISWFLPRRSLTWRALLPGAILFGVGLEFLQLLMAYVAAPKVTSATRLYGVIGIVSVGLATLLLVGRIIVASAHLNVLLWERHQRELGRRDDTLGHEARAAQGVSQTN